MSRGTELSFNLVLAVCCIGVLQVLQGASESVPVLFPVLRFEILRRSAACMRRVPFNVFAAVYFMFLTTQLEAQIILTKDWNNLVTPGRFIQNKAEKTSIPFARIFGCVCAL